MENLTYLLLLLIVIMAIIAIIIFYLALKSKTFDWSWMEDPWYWGHMGAPGFNRWTGFPYSLRNEIRRGSESFKRVIDAMTGKHASPDEYAEHHRRKEKDMR